MEVQQPSPTEIVRPSRRYIYGKYFVAILCVSCLVLVASYAIFAFITKDAVLPAVKIAGTPVGGESKFMVERTIDNISKTKQNEKVTLVDGQEKIEMTFGDIGLSLDKDKTLQNTLQAGRYKNIYPTPKYLFRSIFGGLAVENQFNWDQEKSKRFEETLNKKKKEAKNPTISLKDDQLVITEGEKGSSVDIKTVKKNLEKCFSSGCKNTIDLKKIVIKPDYTAADVEPFKDKINEVINRKMVLTSETKNISVPKENLLSFIDLDRTVLEQKIVYNDNAIGNFIKDKAGKLNTKGKSRVISAVDNSVISEGREAVQVDIDKSIANLKEALNSGNTTSELVISTVPIKEEIQQPGYTLGKYSGKYIEVNLSDQKLYLINGNNLDGTFSVSTGKWSMPTPEGEYYINNKDPRAYSQKYNLYMPYWMAFIGSEYGIHELPEWPDGTKEGESHLGTPVSHGCIRLGRGSAEQVYNWTDIGTPVYIHK